jgi:hypothetical protein
MSFYDAHKSIRDTLFLHLKVIIVKYIIFYDSTQAYKSIIK